MDLAELKFVVDTTQLKEAATRVAELGTAVSKLNKPMQDLATNTAKVSTATEKASKANENKVKGDTKVADSSSKLDSLLDKLTNRYTDMAKGSTSAEAGVLQLARSLGATTEEALKPYKAILENIRELSKSPFDSAIGSVRSITQEYDSLNYRSELAAKGIFLTTNQLKEYSKIASEIKGKVKAVGLDPTQGEGLTKFNSELKIQQDLYLGVANSVNTLKVAEQGRNDVLKAQIKSQNDAAKANEFIANEMERVTRLTASNGDITSATNNRLIKFEQSLRASGRTAAEVTTQLEVYKNALMATQKAAGNRQVDYLSRALGPQITDIAVGLATGQAPLTILLQQGGQLRDQFALAGVAGKDMGDMLTKATLGMVSSVKDVGVAVGGALVGAFMAAGKSVKTFIMDITGTSSALEYVRYQIALLDGSNGTLMKSFMTMGTIVTGIVATAIFSAIAAFIAYGVALKQVIAEESALSKSINLTGGSLGLTTDSALALSEAFAGSKGNVGAYVTAITDIAKAGSITSNNLKTVATTIVEVSRITGISSETLAKNFSKISEKPLEGLIPFAKELGTINVSVLRHIQQLERAGKYTEAAKVATEAYAGALRDASKAIKQDMGFLEDFFFHVARGAKMVWNEILNIGRAVPLAKQLAEAQKELRSLEAGDGFMTDQYRKNSIQGAKAVIEGIEKQLAAQKKLGDEKAKNTADVTKLEKGLKDENKGIKAQQGFDEKNVKQATEAYLTQIGALDHLTKAEVSLLKLRTDPLWEKTPQVIKDQIEALYGAASANEKLVKSEKDFANALETANKFYQTQIGAVEDLTKSEIALNKVKESDVYKSFNDEQKKQIDAIYQQANANEKLVKSEKEAEDALELKNRLLGKSENLGKEYYKTIDLINKYAKEGRFGADEVLQLKAALEATTPEAKRLAAAQAENAKVMAGIAAERTGVADQYGGDFKTADEKAAIKNLSDYKKKISQADAEYEKQIAAATEETTYSEWLMYKKQADAKKALADDVYKREEYLLSDGYKRQQAYANAFENVFKGMADAIADFALTGKTSFGDLTKSIIADLIRMEMQMQMSSIYKGLGGFGGIMNMITGGGGFMNDAGGMELAGSLGFAKGGAFTNSIVDSPTMFKFAKGTGLMGEAGPEAIMPLRRGADGSLGVVAAGASSNVQVVVNNNSNATATTQETVDSRGNRRIEVTIGDMVAAEVNRKGSAVNTAVNSSRNQLVRR